MGGPGRCYAKGNKSVSEKQAELSLPWSHQTHRSRIEEGDAWCGWEWKLVVREYEVSVIGDNACTATVA